MEEEIDKLSRVEEAAVCTLQNYFSLHDLSWKWLHTIFIYFKFITVSIRIARLVVAIST